MAQRQYLIVRSGQPENAYGRFAREILQAEGLMGFEVVDLDDAPLPDLGAQDLVLITRCFLNNADTARLQDAVGAGAALVFLQPQLTLVERFGWQPECSVVLPGFVNVRPGRPGAGAPLRTHLPIVSCAQPESGPEWQVVAPVVSDLGWVVAVPTS